MSLYFFFFLQQLNFAYFINENFIIPKPAVLSFIKSFVCSIFSLIGRLDLIWFYINDDMCSLGFDCLRYQKIRSCVYSHNDTYRYLPVKHSNEITFLSEEDVELMMRYYRFSLNLRERDRERKERHTNRYLPWLQE